MQIAEADSVSSLEIGILDTVFLHVNFQTTELPPQSRYANYYDFVRKNVATYDYFLFNPWETICSSAFCLEQT